MGGMPKIVKESQITESDANHNTEPKDQKVVEPEKELNSQKVNQGLVSGDGKETKVEEIDAMKMQDEVINQRENSGQEINENSTDKLLKSDTAGKELPNETSPQPQAMAESEKEKLPEGISVRKHQKDYIWKVCNVTAGPDYIPCLDNTKALKMLHTTGHYEHRERHCPDEGPTCLVPLPKGYRTPVKWPKSRDMVYFMFWMKAKIDV